MVELLVVLAIIGLIFGVSGLAVLSLRAPVESQWVREWRRAREDAIRAGKPVRPGARRLITTDSNAVQLPLFLPDGRAVGRGADPLTGAPRHAAP